MHLITPGRSLQIPSWELQATRVTNFYQWQVSRAKKPCNYPSQSDSYSYSLSCWLVWNLYALSLHYSLSKEGYQSTLSHGTLTGSNQVRYKSADVRWARRAGGVSAGGRGPSRRRDQTSSRPWKRGWEFIYEDMCRQRARAVLLQPSPGPSVCLPRGFSCSSPYNSHCVISAWSLPFPLTNKPNLTYCWQSYYWRKSILRHQDC